MSWLSKATNSASHYAGAVAGGLASSIPVVGPGIASAIGGQETIDAQREANASNVQQANMSILAQQQGQKEAESFNAGESQKGRDFEQMSQQEAEKYNSQQAQVQRDYETSMSNSAYQRATADMKKAGINPMLAYMQGGASTPSGSTASVGTTGAPTGSIGGISGAQARIEPKPAMGTMLADAANKNISSAIELKRLKNDTDIKTANINNINANTNFADQKAGLVSTQKGLLEKQQNALMSQFNFNQKDFDWDANNIIINKLLSMFGSGAKTAASLLPLFE